VTHLALETPGIRHAQAMNSSTFIDIVAPEKPGKHAVYLENSANSVGLALVASVLLIIEFSLGIYQTLRRITCL